MCRKWDCVSVNRCLTLDFYCPRDVPLRNIIKYKPRVEFHVYQFILSVITWTLLIFIKMYQTSNRYVVGFWGAT